MTIKANVLLILSAILMLGCGSAEVSASTTTPAGASEAEPAPEPAAVEEPVAAADPEDVHLEGDHITIDRHINFGSNSDEILADSHDLIDHIAQFISNHSAQVKHLKIIGHTDAAGGAKHNQELSDRRAAAVVKALQDRGVTIQLEHFGAGETQHLCSEDTDECHAKNRRVEFLVVTE